MAPSALATAIHQADKQGVIDILTDMPNIIWQESGVGGSWINTAIYYACATAKTDKIRADVLDEIVFLLFNHIHHIASNTPDYNQTLTALLQNRNPILQACIHKRENVIRMLSNYISLSWRGAQDDTSPLDWAYAELRADANLNNARNMHRALAATTGSPQHDWGPNPYAETIGLAQHIIAEFQRRNPTVVLAPIPTPSPVTPEHRWKELQRIHAQQQQNLRAADSILNPAGSSSSRWKRVILLAVAAYACKKIYDWWTYKPVDQAADDQQREEYDAYPECSESAR